MGVDNFRNFERYWRQAIEVSFIGKQQEQKLTKVKKERKKSVTDLRRYCDDQRAVLYKGACTQKKTEKPY